MNSNILSLPFRLSKDQPLSSAIRQYISSKYNQHPDMFKEDFLVIDALRNDAIQVVEPHVSGLRKIMAYAAQLYWIGGKFPIDLGVDFLWFPALGYKRDKPVILNNLKFEQASVLYNLAALYSQLASSSDRNTAEGLKLVCNYFCLAAGVIRHIQEKIIPEMQITPPEDLNESTLECLQQLLNAQAQECFWRKAVMDGYRDLSISKLAAMTSELYGTAADWASKSEAISSEWIHFATAKHYHFAAAAQFRYACDCLDKKRYGEEVARLKECILYANKGLKEIKNHNKPVQNDLSSLKNKATEDLKRAEKDNDMIYLCSVPHRAELKNLERTIMIGAKVPLEVSEPLSFIGETKEFGQPLFAKLIPFAVHVASSIFEQRLNRVVNSSIIAPLEALTTKIHSTLSSLSLPGSLQALEKPLGLPLTLNTHAEEIRQSDAISRLKQSFADISCLRQSATSTFAEAESHLNVERKANELLKLKYGTDRWSRPESALAAPRLYKKLEEIDGYIEKATNSDLTVHEKFQECHSVLRILSGGDHALRKYIPSANHVIMSPRLEEQVFKLRSCLNELTHLESVRCKNIENLRERAKKDDITPAILDETARLERMHPAQSLVPAHFENFLENRLSEYDSCILALKPEEEDQNRMLKNLERCHREFVEVKSEDNFGSKEREKALQILEDAYYQYKEIIVSLEAGRKFYNDLIVMVGKFNDEVKLWTAERRSEADIIEREIKSGLSLPTRELPSFKPLQDLQQPMISKKIHLEEPAQPQPDFIPKHANSLTEDSRKETSKLSLQTQPSSEPVISVWMPNLGIKFGDTEAHKSYQSNSSYTINGVDTSPSPKNDLEESNATNISRMNRFTNNNFSGNSDETRTNHTWDPQMGLRFG